MSTKTRKIVLAAMLAALCCVATMIIRIPSPLKGYINLGDCVVLLAGFCLSPVYGFLAAGIGSFLADIFSGYVVYAPATFIIKGSMALAAYYGFKCFGKRCKKAPARIMSGAVSEILMAAGYLTFEGFLYGFAASAVNIPANLIQGCVGLILGVIIAEIFDKHKNLM